MVMNIAIGHSKYKVLHHFEFCAILLNLLYVYGLKLKFYGLCAKCKPCELLYVYILCAWFTLHECVCLAKYYFLFFDHFIYYLQLNKEEENTVTLFKVNTYNPYELWNLQIIHSNFWKKKWKHHLSTKENGRQMRMQFRWAF